VTLFDKRLLPLQPIPVMDTMIVWVVWAGLAGTPSADPRNPQAVLDQGKRIATNITFDMPDTATIQPASMFDLTKDVPDLRQALPNGDATLVGSDPVDNVPLSGGVSALWDMSRRKTIRAGVTDGNGNDHAWKPLTADPFMNYPTDPIVGNDDASAADEDNNPYDPAHLGKIMVTDHVIRESATSMPMEDGYVGDFYTSKVWFKDFARLRLGGTWYLVSDPLLWRVEFHYKKKIVDEALWGDLDGNPGNNLTVTEADMGRDVNGDNDAANPNDDVGYWDQDPNAPSITAGDNAGIP
jgi:hypothetical protein